MIVSNNGVVRTSLRAAGHAGRYAEYARVRNRK